MLLVNKNEGDPNSKSDLFRIGLIALGLLTLCKIESFVIHTEDLIWAAVTSNTNIEGFVTTFAADLLCLMPLVPFTILAVNKFFDSKKRN